MNYQIDFPKISSLFILTNCEMSHINFQNLINLEILVKDWTFFWCILHDISFNWAIPRHAAVPARSGHEPGKGLRMEIDCLDPSLPPEALVWSELVAPGCDIPRTGAMTIPKHFPPWDQPPQLTSGDLGKPTLSNPQITTKANHKILSRFDL